MRKYKVFVSSCTSYCGCEYYGVMRITRRFFMPARKEVLHYFLTKEEAYRFILNCRRLDRYLK